MFEANHPSFQRLGRANGFELSESKLLLFGLRGCLPIELDWFRPRCALGIWDRGRQVLGATSGSTVPNRASVSDSLDRWRQGRRESANQMMPSLVTYKKGPHKISEPQRSFPAFRQEGEFALQRSRDDLDYDATDEILIDVVGDNIRPAYLESSNAPTEKGIGSDSCQVVVGFARRKDGSGEDRGMWPRFRDTAYASGQELFCYILLDAADAQRAAVSPDGTIPLRLRCRSSGPVVKKLQPKLKRLSLLVDDEKGLLAKHTLLAVVGFQRSEGLIPDGVIGANTAEVLGIADNWPRL